MRAVLALHEAGWLVVDRVSTARPVEAEAYWHLHPAWTASMQGNHAVALTSASGRLAFASTAATSLTRDPAIASVSLEYGRVERATTVRTHVASAVPFVMAAFVPAQVESGAVAIELLESEALRDERWTHAAFAIHANGRTLEVTVPFPTQFETRPSEREWPLPCIRQPRGNEIVTCVE